MKTNLNLLIIAIFLATLGSGLGQTPVITVQPTNSLVSLGATVGNRVVATGTPPLNYQWRFNGLPLSGQTAAALSLASAELANAGSYDIVVSNFAGSVTRIWDFWARR